ncbi:hypothetical protein BDZ89DRAFT_1144835 [Hymenopellis radicata]|nr:hypothetical protein BDZ89DRAFT_1144835 [Hymenopellis radicata]
MSDPLAARHQALLSRTAAFERASSIRRPPTTPPHSDTHTHVNAFGEVTQILTPSKPKGRPVFRPTYRPRSEGEAPELEEKQEEHDTDDEEEEVKVSATKTKTRKVIESFHAILPHLHDLLMEREVDPCEGTECLCGRGLRTVRCEDCLDYPVSCSECFMERHRGLWTHWAEEWHAGGFFLRRDLRHFGFELDLGHPGGTCPTPRPAVDLIVVDVNGIHDCRVRYCGCRGSEVSRLDQLMRTSLFAATTAQPRMAFTFRILRTMNLEHLECTANVYDLAATLQRLTDNKYPWRVPSVAKQLRRVFRVWNLAKEERRCGLVVEKNKHAFPTRQEDTLLVFCPMCPERGVNLLKGWENIPAEYKHLIQAQNTLDGNFKISMGCMNAGTNDIDLLRGRGLQPDAEEMKKYRNSPDLPQSSGREKVPCNNLKAANEQQQHVRNIDCTYNGIAQGQCRHVFIKSTADFPKGEDQKTVDAAAKLLLERSGFEPNLDPSAPHQPFALSYDAHCQYCVHVDDRFQHPFLKPMAEHMRTCTKIINAAHVYAHAGDCIYRFGSFYMEHQGHFHGETCEYFWPKSNAYAAMIFKMNIHHGHEVYFYVANDWNWKKYMNAPNELHKDVIYARRQYLRFRAEFLIATEQNADWVERWDAEWTDRHVPGKHYRQTGKGKSAVITSPYKHSQVKLPNLESVLNTLLENPVQFVFAGSVDSAKFAQWLSDGVALEARQRHLRLLVGRQSKYPSPTDQETIRREREALVLVLDPWLKLRQQYFGDVQPNVGRARRTLTKKEARYKSTGLVETWTLCLPSDLTEEHQDKLRQAVDQEILIREACAFQSIRLVGLIARELIALGYSKDLKYTGPQTKSRERISRAKFRRDVAISSYNDHRQALINMRGLEQTKLAGRPDMKVIDAYIGRSVDGVRVPGASTERTGAAHLWERSYQTINMARGYSERSSGKRLMADPGPSTPTKRKKLNTGSKQPSVKKRVRGDGWVFDIVERGTLTDAEIEAWEMDGERVRWFRLEAEMRHWRDEHEMKQREFLGAIQTLRMEQAAWTSRADEIEKEVPPRPGYVAYAREHAAMYAEMAERLLELGDTPLWVYFEQVRAGELPMCSSEVSENVERMEDDDELDEADEDVFN